MNEWIDLISNVGVPSAILFYVMVRLEKSMKAVETALNTLISKVH